MNFVVLFNKHTARVLYNPENITQFYNRENALISPDLTLVNDTPMHYWKKSGDKVIPMSKEDMVLRDKNLEEIPHCAHVLEIDKNYAIKRYWVTIALSFILGVLLTKVFNG